MGPKAREGSNGQKKELLIPGLPASQDHCVAQSTQGEAFRPKLGTEEQLNMGTESLGLEVHLKECWG